MREDVRCKKVIKGKEFDTLLPADSLATVHVHSEADGEIPPAIWVTCHRQYSHYCGAEGNKSKNQMKQAASDPRGQKEGHTCHLGEPPPTVLPLL